jgi:hypothetical protein
LLLVGWIVFASSHSRAEKRQTTDKHVTALAERLDAQVERGRYKRIDPAAITDTDSWGRPIRVEYREEGVAERAYCPICWTRRSCSIRTMISEQIAS